MSDGTTQTSSELPIELSEPAVADVSADSGTDTKGFRVRLDNFEGPFDLLLQLISKHRLDITEIALARVTDDFIAHIKAMGSEWDLDQASEFLLVAATLLDLKAARLLPRGEVEDADDLALLEARDLLFARLLQYRAFKQIAALVNARMAQEAKRFPRAVSMEPRFARLLPEVLIGISPDGLAALAAAAMAPKPVPELSLAHLHAPIVTVREQATFVVERLRRTRASTFRALVADSPDLPTTVCRFLALLELFREGAVAFDQLSPLGELTIRWTGSDTGEIEVGDEFDHPPNPSDDDQPDDESAHDQLDPLHEPDDQPDDRSDSSDGHPLDPPVHDQLDPLHEPDDQPDDRSEDGSDRDQLGSPKQADSLRDGQVEDDLPDDEVHEPTVTTDPINPTDNQMDNDQ